MITATPITSHLPIRSPRSAQAMTTPKNGLRKWNVEALTAPMRRTSRNQITVASRPGTSTV